MDENLRLLFLSILVFLIVLATSLGTNLLSINSLGTGGIFLSVSSFLISYLAIVSLKGELGKNSWLLVALCLVAGFVAAFAALGFGSFSFSGAAAAFLVFGLIAPTSNFVRSNLVKAGAKQGAPAQ
ncbi:hypothetical protein FJZ26_01170 [Candidatus Parvarchaeota archaeon]|nr:hypothetical protein [Candidatus Parvarchaeota archaeon]